MYRSIVLATSSTYIRLPSCPTEEGGNLGESTANDVSMRHGSQRESWKRIPPLLAKPCFRAPSYPCSACVPFFYTSYMLVFINKIENPSFFFCFHYHTSNRAAIIHFCLVVICCLVHHDIDDMPPFGGYGGCGFALANPSIAPCVHSRNLSY
jgi:hypothetical protein